MELLKPLLVEEEGQGLVEYTLIVVLVAFSFGLPLETYRCKRLTATVWAVAIASRGS